MADIVLFNPPRSRRAGDQVLNTAMLWLASSLRQHGREAVIRTPSGPYLAEEVAACLSAERPRLVAISCKWWNTLHGALEVAAAVRRAVPGLPVVLGGHTASVFPRELIATGVVDVVLTGDVDDSLVALVCDGVVTGGYTAAGYHPRAPSRTPARRLDDVALEPLASLLDRPDLAPGYVWIGRGCAFDCFYCLESRDTGALVLGRGAPRLRDVAAVARDTRALAGRRQLIVDYEHPSAAETQRFVGALAAQASPDMRTCYYFHWGLPSDALLDTLADRFDEVGVCLDLQSFCEPHRRLLSERRLIKPFFPDEAVEAVLVHAEALGNVHVDATALVGMPFEDGAMREQGLRFIERLVARYRSVRDFRPSPLHVIPGTALARGPRFHDLDVLRRTFEDFRAFGREAYEDEVPYYSPERRSHAHGVHPHGEPLAIVEFMRDADARLLALRAERRRSAIDRSDGVTRIHLEDPFTPLPALLALLDSPRPTRRLRVELGERTFFHGAWADYTSESGENCALRGDVRGDVPALRASLVSRLELFDEVVLHPAQGRWGVIGDEVTALEARRAAGTATADRRVSGGGVV